VNHSSGGAGVGSLRQNWRWDTKREAAGYDDEEFLGSRAVNRGRHILTPYRNANCSDSLLTSVVLQTAARLEKRIGERRGSKAGTGGSTKHSSRGGGELKGVLILVLISVGPLQHLGACSANQERTMVSFSSVTLEIRHSFGGCGRIRQ
jgi:hypothetical protein